METPQEAAGEVASEAVQEDPWEAAESAFDAVETPSEAKQEAKEEVKAPDSQVEVEVPDYLKLDDLRVPNKYKEAVKERLSKVASTFEEKQKAASEAANQELGQYKESVIELVNLFKDLAQTPKEKVPHKIADLIEKYGTHVGIDPSSASNYREQQQQVQQQQQQAALTLEAINQQFLDRMVRTEDPAEFRRLWEQADILKSQVLEQQMMNKVGLLFKAYHDKYIAPDKQTLNEFKTKAQQQAEEAHFNSKKSSWNSAADSLVSKYQDFEKYKPQISKIIKEQKHFSAGRDALNDDPSDVEGRTAFLENIYLAISRNSAIETAKRPVQGGLPPSQKHVQTRKPSSGGDWNDVWESQKDQWE